MALVALSTAQPFLISRAVTFIEAAEDETPQNVGFGLIGAFALVFIGIAVRRHEQHAASPADHGTGDNVLVRTSRLPLHDGSMRRLDLPDLPEDYDTAAGQCQRIWCHVSHGI